jgi:hypothetical protein
MVMRISTTTISLVVPLLAGLSSQYVCANTGDWESSSRYFAHQSRRTTKSRFSHFTRPFSDTECAEPEEMTTTLLCSSSISSIASIPSTTVGKTLLRGALLRIASDLTGGTVMESIKTRVSVARDEAGPISAARSIIKEGGGVRALWTGTPSRTVEGALIGALFLVASATTKRQCLQRFGASNTVAALAGGIVGGVAQSLVMTPAGLVFTSLHSNKHRKGYENENAFKVTRRIVAEKGFFGLYAGNAPMVVRQATNWASRSGLTELARSTLGLSKYGVWGEIGSGVIGGVGSCWNTPVETIRVVMQRDMSRGKSANSMGAYWHEIKDTEGYAGLFRGVSPRALQAVWQTVFLVAVPNIMGI